MPSTPMHLPITPHASRGSVVLPGSRSRRLWTQAISATLQTIVALWRRRNAYPAIRRGGTMALRMPSFGEPARAPRGVATMAFLRPPPMACSAWSRPCAPTPARRCAAMVPARAAQRRARSRAAFSRTRPASSTPARAAALTATPTRSLSPPACRHHRDPRLSFRAKRGSTGWWRRSSDATIVALPDALLDQRPSPRPDREATEVHLQCARQSADCRARPRPAKPRNYPSALTRC